MRVFFFLSPQTVGNPNFSDSYIRIGRIWASYISSSFFFFSFFNYRYISESPQTFQYLAGGGGGGGGGAGGRGGGRAVDQYTQANANTHAVGKFSYWPIHVG